MSRGCFRLFFFAWLALVVCTFGKFLPEVVADAVGGNPEPLVQFVPGMILLAMQFVGGMLMLHLFFSLLKLMERAFKVLG